MAVRVRTFVRAYVSTSCFYLLLNFMGNPLLKANFVHMPSSSPLPSVFSLSSPLLLGFCRGPSPYLRTYVALTLLSFSGAGEVYAHALGWVGVPVAGPSRGVLALALNGSMGSVRACGGWGRAGRIRRPEELPGGSWAACPPSSSPTPLNDSFLRAYVRTYVNHDSNAYVHTYVRMQVHRKRLKSVDGGGRESREEGKRDHGKILTYERTYLRGNGGAAVAASRGAVLGEDKSALPSLSTPGTSS